MVKSAVYVDDVLNSRVDQPNENMVMVNNSFNGFKGGVGSKFQLVQQQCNKIVLELKKL